MILLDFLVIIWFVINVVSAYLFIIISFDTAEELYDILIYSPLIRVLRERLNKAGTVIVTILFSIFFMPAIIIYFISLVIVAILFLIVKCFIKIFERKD